MGSEAVPGTLPDERSVRRAAGDPDSGVGLGVGCLVSLPYSICVGVLTGLIAPLVTGGKEWCSTSLLARVAAGPCPSLWIDGLPLGRLWLLLLAVPSALLLLHRLRLFGDRSRPGVAIAIVPLILLPPMAMVAGASPLECAHCSNAGLTIGLGVSGLLGSVLLLSLHRLLPGVELAAQDSGVGALAPRPGPRLGARLALGSLAFLALCLLAEWISQARIRSEAQEALAGFFAKVESSGRDELVRLIHPGTRQLDPRMTASLLRLMVDRLGKYQGLGAGWVVVVDRETDGNSLPGGCGIERRRCYRGELRFERGVLAAEIGLASDLLASLELLDEQAGPLLRAVAEEPLDPVACAAEVERIVRAGLQGEPDALADALPRFWPGTRPEELAAEFAALGARLGSLDRLEVTKQDPGENPARVDLVLRARFSAGEAELTAGFEREVSLSPVVSLHTVLVELHLPLARAR